MISELHSSFSISDLRSIERFLGQFDRSEGAKVSDGAQQVPLHMTFMMRSNQVYPDIAPDIARHIARAEESMSMLRQKMKNP